MSPERIAHLRALIAAATPGPWRHDSDGDVWTESWTSGENGDENSVGTEAVFRGHESHDAALIAEARTALPEALDYIEVIETATRRLCAAHDALKAKCSHIPGLLTDGIRHINALATERDALKAEVERERAAYAEADEAATMVIASLDREVDALCARVARLEAVVRGFLPSLDPSAIARFDALAEEFYQDTGVMAPGKSVPMEMAREQPSDDDLRIQWRGWLDARLMKLQEAALAALDEVK